jgi:hypothetical protein
MFQAEPPADVFQIRLYYDSVGAGLEHILLPMKQTVVKSPFTKEKRVLTNAMAWHNMSLCDM